MTAAAIATMATVEAATSTRRDLILVAVGCRSLAYRKKRPAIEPGWGHAGADSRPEERGGTEHQGLLFVRSFASMVPLFQPGFRGPGWWARCHSPYWAQPGTRRPGGEPRPRL